MKNETVNLNQLISDYLFWMLDKKYSSQTIDNYEKILNPFESFICDRRIDMKHFFDQNVLDSFYKTIQLPDAHKPINGFIQFLKKEKIIYSDTTGPKNDLCGVFFDYFNYFKRCGRAQKQRQKQVRSVLKAFSCFLENKQISLNNLNIELIDQFFFEKYKAKKSLADHQSALRGFLAYLYYEADIGNKDLSASLISPPTFNRNNPSKFLRHNEIKRLLDAASGTTDKNLRVNAMVRLALATGIRPSEIANISLDDICFKTKTLAIPVRKSNNPFKLPLPEDTIKAIAAYIIGSRPEIKERSLFLSLNPPYFAISAGVVTRSIGELMKKANVPGKPYNLRHTYAQNLLVSGASIFEVKDMMGHDSFATTMRYLHIDTQLMRKVLFDE